MFVFGCLGPPAGLGHVPEPAKSISAGLQGGCRRRSVQTRLSFDGGRGTLFATRVGENRKPKTENAWIPCRLMWEIGRLASRKSPEGRDD